MTALTFKRDDDNDVVLLGKLHYYDFISWMDSTESKFVESDTN